jgi:hypothetical protein
MKLLQIVTVNGEEFRNVSEDIFGQLSVAQQSIGIAYPALGTTWLQERADLREVMGRLFHCGRASMFSLESQVRVEIEWTFQPDVVAIEEAPDVVDVAPEEEVQETPKQYWAREVETSEVYGISVGRRRLNDDELEFISAHSPAFAWESSVDEHKVYVIGDRVICTLRNKDADTTYFVPRADQRRWWNAYVNDRGNINDCPF